MCTSCRYIHSLLLVPLFPSVTAFISVVGVALHEGYSLCEICEFVSLSPRFPNKYYVLNTWFVTPCGELPITSRHLPSVRGQRGLGRGGTFCVDCPQGAYLSGRGGGTTYNQAWGENLSPWVGAGALSDLGNLAILCLIL